MEKELQKKIEELRNAIVEKDIENNVMSINFNEKSKLLEVHVYRDFPPCENYQFEYVWRDDETYPWQKQIIINGVLYFDCIRQEQFDAEHKKEVA